MALENSDAGGSLMLRLSGIEPESIVDGPGIRYVVFVQGCPHHCKGCHNPQTHDFKGGYMESQEKLLEEIKENPLVSGVTFSGGEPFCQAEALAQLGKKVKAMGKHLIVYSGYTLEQLLEKGKSEKGVMDLLRTADVLVDGPFIEELKDLNLRFRGSSNQRYIELKDIWDNK